MKVDEILSAINKFRQDKLKSTASSRSKSPISVVNPLAKVQSRSITPLHPYSGEAFDSHHKPYRPTITHSTFHKPNQIMDYKVDAAGLIMETLQKFKRRIFQLFEKNIRNTNFNMDISFKGSIKPFICPKTRKEYTSKANYFDDKEFYLSPSFNNQSKILFGGLSCVSEGLGMISSVLLLKLENLKKLSFIHLKEFIKSAKILKTFEKLTNLLTHFYCKQILTRLRKRDAFHKRTWELPLKIDLRNISQKSEVYEFSSADQSEVLFEPILDSSSQFTNRFQNSGDRNIKDLTLSSIISNEDRQNTDRVFNLTRLKQTRMAGRKKISYDITDSLSDSRSLQNAKFNFKNSKNRLIQKPLGILSFILENNLKNYGFCELGKCYLKWKKQKSLEKIGKIVDSKLRNLVNVLKRMKDLPDSLRKLFAIWGSKGLIVVVKSFVKWRFFNRVVKDGTKRRVAVVRMVMMKVKMIVVKRKSEIFEKIRSLGNRTRLWYPLILCMCNSLKKVVQVAKYRKKMFAFSILNAVHKELVIKAFHMGKIVGNVGKDIKFRMKVCFCQWKKCIETEKSQYLQGLSFIQLVTHLFEAKKRYAFNVLSYYERSFLNISYT